MKLTYKQLRARFPKASEAFLRANCAVAPSVTPSASPQPAAGKGTQRKGHSRVARTRNAGTWTEAQFWGALRSGLRRTFRWWKPALAALHAARMACKGPRGQKWAYVCAGCGGRFLRKQVQIDHVVPCGTLTDYGHVGEFLRRLTPEAREAFKVRCKKCHQQKTNQERAA